MKKAMIALFLSLGAAGISACDTNDGPVEEAGEEIDDAADEIEDEVD
jgi:predicted small secreted protein